MTKKDKHRWNHTRTLTTPEVQRTKYRCAVCRDTGECQKCLGRGCMNCTYTGECNCTSRNGRAR